MFIKMVVFIQHCHFLYINKKENNMNNISFANLSKLQQLTISLSTDLGDTPYPPTIPPEPEPITQPNDEIWYTTSDNDILHNVPDSYYSDEGAILVSHTYDGVKGVLKFSGNVTKLPDWFATNGGYTNINLKTISLPSTLENMGSWAMQCCWDLEEIKFNGTHCFYGFDALHPTGVGEGVMYVPRGFESSYYDMLNYINDSVNYFGQGGYNWRIETF